MELTVFQRQQKTFRVVLLRVAAADAQDTVARSDRDSVAEWTRQLADDPPSGVGFFQRKHGVIPDFFSVLPRFLVGKIRTAGDNEATVRDTRKSTGKSFTVRKRRQL